MIPIPANRHAAMDCGGTTPGKMPKATKIPPMMASARNTVFAMSQIYHFGMAMKCPEKGKELDKGA